MYKIHFPIIYDMKILGHLDEIKLWHIRKITITSPYLQRFINNICTSTIRKKSKVYILFQMKLLAGGQPTWQVNSHISRFNRQSQNTHKFTKKMNGGNNKCYVDTILYNGIYTFKQSISRDYVFFLFVFIFFYQNSESWKFTAGDEQRIDFEVTAILVRKPTFKCHSLRGKKISPK